MNSTPHTFNTASASASAHDRTSDTAAKRSGTVSPEMSPAVGFATLATPMAAQVVQRLTALCANADPETPHKLRVALRRLRSLWWAYAPLIDKRQARQQRREFKALADSAGQTRDWDILKHLLLEDTAALHSFEALVERIDLLRDEALLSSRASMVAANVEAMLTARIETVMLQLDGCSFDEPLATFAANRVAVAQNVLHKRIRRVLMNPDAEYAELHDVRIAGKKMRYLLEFFAPLLDRGNEIGVTELTQMQDELGQLNDIVSSEALLVAHAVQLGGHTAVEDAMTSLRHRKDHHMTDINARLRAFSDTLAGERPGTSIAPCASEMPTIPRAL